MSITDTIYIKTQLNPIETVELFLKGIGYEAQIGDYIGGTGTTIYYAEVPEFVVYPKSISADYLVEEIRIIPTVEMRVSPEYDVDLEEYRNLLVRAVLELLQTTGADVALKIDTGNYLALIYQSGHLSINKRLSMWTSSRLAFVKMPYTLEDLST